MKGVLPTERFPGTPLRNGASFADDVPLSRLVATFYTLIHAACLRLGRAR